MILGESRVECCTGSDTNKDGSLDKAELSAGAARLRDGRGGEGGRGEKGGGEKGGRPQRPAAEGEDKEEPKKDEAP